jgi:tetratricopeptide (TPR) repeat protein
MADVNEAIRIDPKYVTALNDRGYLYQRRSDFDRAIADYDAAIAVNPRWARLFNDRGLAWERKTNNDRALADYSEAVRLDPKWASPLNLRGLLYERTGKLDLALADFKAVVAIDPKTAGVAERVARIEGKLAVLTAPPAPKPGVPSPPPKVGETRVALVIGNGAYKFSNQLPNPRNDAGKIADTLKKIGFTSVTLKTDLPRDKLIEALKAFAAEASRADWAVVYYAGHGIEIGGVNYVVPVDAKLASDRDVAFEAVALEQVLLGVEGARKLRLVILDACRDNPFVPKMTRSLATRSIGKGLADVEPEGATLIAYAAKHGHVAEDGQSGNSPFVAALVKHLETPDLEINFVFRRVRDDVLKVTDRRQEPFLYGSLPAEPFYFRKKGT